MTESSAVQKETHVFKTEVNQLLDLVVHSLYSHKDIFLRELISNASDAIDKRRYQALTDQSLALAEGEWKIKLIPDKAAGTLTVRDNGIGMSHEDLITHLGTIAKSGTKEFLSQLKEKQGDMNLIGQFGVGFYSAFMVADRVAVVTKAGEDQAYRWQSDGKGGFEIEEASKDQRGTDVILTLKEDCKNYLEEWELRQLVKKYSDFVEFPIAMDIEREEVPRDEEGKPKEGEKPVKTVTEETLNSRQAIWAKAKQDITEEEYKEFYQHVSHDFTDPLETIHYRAEGTTEFKALLYIPGHAPYDLFLQEGHKGVHLYINRIFIMSDAKTIIPQYLRFVRGVVDASDLPLNVSREILQQNAQLEKIKKNIVNKVLSTLKTMKDKDFDKYLKFYQAFGTVLKEGIHYDHDNKEKIAELLLFESTKQEPGQYRTLEQYVTDMPEAQKNIYYIISENRKAALASPHLEIFQSKQQEVLIMTETIDEVVVQGLMTYKDKPLKSVERGDLDLDDAEKAKIEEEQQKAKETYKDLLGRMQDQLKDDIKEVRFSKRLTDSPACLVVDETGISKQMEQLFKAMGQEIPPQKYILELNPHHPLVEKMNSQMGQEDSSSKLADYISLVYDQALLTAGYKLKDPQAFAKRMTELMVQAG